MTKVLLHLGMGKSGSSALQQFLSMSPEMSLGRESAYRKLKYVAVNRYGEIYYGKSLRHFASVSPNRYMKSADMQHLTKLSDEDILKVRETLPKIADGGRDLPVLSSEDWHMKGRIFSAHELFGRFEIAPSAICYVRNPVELINSSWWQWGAWWAVPFEKFIDGWIGKFKMLPEALAYWERLCEGELEVVALPRDVVEDFCERFDIAERPDRSIRSNTSLPAEILRFYQCFPELRSSIGSPLDFILEEQVSFGRMYHKTPWVLSQRHIEKILTETEPAIRKVAEMFDADSLSRYENDPRWHTVEAFSGREYSAPEYSPEMLEREMLEQMLYDTVTSLADLRKKYQQAQLKLKRMEGLI